MKKKTILILAAVLAVIACIAVWFFTSFNGSLIYKHIFTRSAKEYVSSNFPEENLSVDFAGYDFKFGGYFCNVTDPESEDGSFTVYRYGDGTLHDDYELRVGQKENTISRLSRKLDDCLDAFLAENYPYRTSLSFLDIAGEISQTERDVLTPDMPLDPATFPLPCNLVVWTETKNSEPSWEEAPERLRELYVLTKDAFPFITSVSLSIEEPYVLSDGQWEPAERLNSVYVFDVPASVIETEELETWLLEERKRQEAEEAALRADPAYKQ